MIRVTQVTKRDIFEIITHGFQGTMQVSDFHSDFGEFYRDEEVNYKITLYGRLEEIEFLERLYNLNEMESYDNRYNNAAEDIWHHTVKNNDYEIFWVFKDERFGLFKGEDSVFLRFVCELFHPEVRVENEPWKEVLKKINSLLEYDGYELYESSKISGRSVYNWKFKNSNLIIEGSVRF